MRSAEDVDADTDASPPDGKKSSFDDSNKAEAADPGKKEEDGHASAAAMDTGKDEASAASMMLPPLSRLPTGAFAPPPITTVSIKVKTVVNPKTHKNEVVSVSAVARKNVLSIPHPMNQPGA